MFGRLEWDESKLSKFSSEILKYIFKNHAGSFYKFGLAEATDQFDFDIQLFSFKEKWESSARFEQLFKIKRSVDPHQEVS